MRYITIGCKPWKKNGQDYNLQVRATEMDGFYPEADAAQLAEALRQSLPAETLEALKRELNA